MKIGIDARFLTHPQSGGFKTYTEELIAALAKIDTQNEYILYIDRPPDDKSRLPTNHQFASRIVSASLPMIGMPWREQVSLIHQVSKDQIDLFHSPCLTAPLLLTCPLVITIHDMIWAFPKKFSRSGARSTQRKLMEWYNIFVPKYASKHASAIITVSQASKESIIEHLGLDAKQIFVTYEAASPSFRVVKDDQLSESIRSKYQLPTHFILAIGSADPRKNLSALLKAYSMLPTEIRENYHLVIVWTHAFLADEFSKQVNNLGLANKTRFLQNISNNDLALLYNAASLFAFPSLYEGFGLPPLEAMACGVPVVAANNSSIPEIVGDAARLFDTTDVVEMATTINQVLSDDGLKAMLSKKGLERARCFSWDKCAQETLNVYNKVLSSS
jgi:glycosyltransferase involved in cell wall biosynthesis